MSRIGKMPIAVPAGVEVTVAEGNLVTVKGPKGTLTINFVVNSLKEIPPIILGSEHDHPSGRS